MQIFMTDFHELRFILNAILIAKLKYMKNVSF